MQRSVIVFGSWLPSKRNDYSLKYSTIQGSSATLGSLASKTFSNAIRFLDLDGKKYL